MGFCFLTISCLLEVGAHWWPGSLTAPAPPQWAAKVCWTSLQTSSLWTHSLWPFGNIWILRFCPQISKSSFQSSRPRSCTERINGKNGAVSHSDARRFSVQMPKTGSEVKAQRRPSGAWCQHRLFSVLWKWAIAAQMGMLTFCCVAKCYIFLPF